MNGRRAGRLALAALLSLAPPARAQEAPPAPTASLPDVSAQVCALPDDLLDVTLSGQARGTRFVRRGAGGRLYLDAGALRAAEAGYADARASCDGVDYVRLAPELRFDLDPAKQTLSIGPALGRLPTNDLDFGGVLDDGVANVPVSTAYGADLGVRGSYTYGGPLSGLAYLGGSAFGDRWGAQASALAELGGALRITPRARAQYSINKDWAVGLGYNVGPLTDASGSPNTNELRLELSAQFGFQRVLPALIVQLPLEADLRVVIGGRAVRSFHAAPGVLTLRNLPLPGSVGQIEVYVRDATGETVQRYPYAFNPATLPPGALTLRGGAAYGPLGLGGDAALTFGISDHLIGSASAAYRGGGYRASLGASGLWDNTALTASVGVAGFADSHPVVTAFGAYALSADPLYLRLSAGGQVLPLLAPTLGASLGYRAGRFNAQADAGYALSAGTLDLGVSGSFLLSDAQALTASVGVSGGRLRVGLGLRATFSDQLQADVALAGPSGAGVLGVAPAASVRLALAPNSQLAATASARELAASYLYAGPVEVDARASTTGVSGGVRGAVTFANGQTLLSARAASTGLLIRTGVPGLSLRVNGSTALTTDAGGNAFVPNLTGGSEASISLSLDDLPITISAGDLSASVLIPTGGVAELDWRANFTVSRWLRFLFADGSAAAHASVQAGGLRFSTDDQGWALLPAGLAGQLATVREDEGNRACSVTLPQGGETARCAP